MVLSTDEEARMPAITRANGPMMLRGTLTRFRRRCGKPSCRCAAGDPHEGPALTFTEGGRTKTVTLAEAQVAEVAAALARYRQARAELDRAADAGIAALRARRAGGQRGPPPRMASPRPGTGSARWCPSWTARRPAGSPTASWRLSWGRLAGI